MIDGFLWKLMACAGLFILGVELGRRYHEDPWGKIGDGIQSGYKAVRKPLTRPVATPVPVADAWQPA